MFVGPVWFGEKVMLRGVSRLGRTGQTYPLPVFVQPQAEDAVYIFKSLEKRFKSTWKLYKLYIKLSINML